ncbi:hypothetical protein [Flavobacterium daejeonense]|nr:hypothetical protein [Flavobacterium daejeonense]
MKKKNDNFKNEDKFTVIEKIFFFFHTWFFVKPDEFFKNLKDKLKK